MLIDNPDLKKPGSNRVATFAKDRLMIAQRGIFRFGASWNGMDNGQLPNTT